MRSPRYLGHLLILIPIGIFLVGGCPGGGGGGGAGGGEGSADVGDPKAGQAIYAANCVQCHGERGMNNPPLPEAPDLGTEEYEFEEAEDIEEALSDEDHPGGTFSGLDSDAYADLAAFVAGGVAPEDPCDGVVCDPGQECNPAVGQCEDVDEDLCDGVACEAGQECDPATGLCQGGVECECVGDNCDVLTGGDPILRDFALPVPLFAADSAWHQRADTAAVLPESDEQLLVLYRVLLGDSTSVVPEIDLLWPFMDVNYDAFSFPVFSAGEGEQEVLIRDYDGVLSWPHDKFPEAERGEGGPITVPAPAGPVRPAGPTGLDSDAHVVLYDVDNAVEYDFWGVTTFLDADGNTLGGGLPGPAILEAGAADFFDVTGPGVNPDGLWSARAAGTPLLAGLILPEDVQNGVIDHALACATPRTRNTGSDPSEPASSDYMYPASTTEAENYNTNPLAMASGQRLRLKQTIVNDEDEPIDEDTLAPITRMYLTALRTYGAYVVDNSEGFTFYAEDIHTANLQLSDEEVNELIGQPADSPLSPCKTKWQMVMEKLNDEVGAIPLASGPWEDYEPGGKDPATATFDYANFEVVEPAIVPPL